MATIEYITVLSLCASHNEAALIAEKVIEDAAAATVQIIHCSDSIYNWEGQICNDKQFLLMIHTHRDKFEHVKETIVQLSSFEAPMVIALPVLAANREYISFVNESLTKN